MRDRWHKECHVNTKQIREYRPGKVQEESDSLETDQKMRNTQNKKYQFVEADLPVIRFQVPLKKDKITARGDQPQESIIFSQMAVTFDT